MSSFQSNETTLLGPDAGHMTDTADEFQFQCLLIGLAMYFLLAAFIVGAMNGSLTFLSVAELIDLCRPSSTIAMIISTARRMLDSVATCLSRKKPEQVVVVPPALGFPLVPRSKDFSLSCISPIESPHRSCSTPATRRSSKPSENRWQEETPPPATTPTVHEQQPPTAETVEPVEPVVPVETVCTIERLKPAVPVPFGCPTKWAALREAGATVMVPTAMDLPAALREAIQQKAAAGQHHRHSAPLDLGPWCKEGLDPQRFREYLRASSTECKRARFMQAERRAAGKPALSSMLLPIGQQQAGAAIVEGDEDELVIEVLKHSWRGTYERLLRLSPSGLETRMPDATRRITNVWRLSQIQIVTEPVGAEVVLGGRTDITLCVAQQFPVPWRQELSFSVGSAEERAIFIEQLSVLQMRAAA